MNRLLNAVTDRCSCARHNGTCWKSSARSRFQIVPHLTIRFGVITIIGRSSIAMDRY